MRRTIGRKQTQMKCLEEKEDYYKELEDEFHEKTKACENYLQYLQGKVTELRSQMEIEMTNSEHLLA